MSPTVFREKGYGFFFFSREEERMHVHIVSGDGEAKFWLEPEIALARNYYYNRKQPKATLAHYHEFWRRPKASLCVIAFHHAISMLSKQCLDPDFWAAPEFMIIGQSCL